MDEFLWFINRSPGTDLQFSITCMDGFSGLHFKLSTFNVERESYLNFSDNIANTTQSRVTIQNLTAILLS